MAHPEEHPADSDLPLSVPDAGRLKLRHAGHRVDVHFFAQQLTDPMAEFVVDCSNKQDREFTSSVIGAYDTWRAILCSRHSNAHRAR